MADIKFYRSITRLVVLAFLLSLPVTTTQAEMLCSEATSSSVTLTWTTPGDNGSDGTANLYHVRYALFEITKDNWSLATPVTGNVPTPLTAGILETCVVNNLAEDTLYYFAIKTADEIPNWSLLSPVVSRRTLSSAAALPPDPIVDLSITNPSSTSLTLHWTSPDNGSGSEAFRYFIQYSSDSLTSANLTNSTGLIEIPAPGPVGTHESFTVTGLESSIDYYFTIRSSNSDFVWSEMSNVVSNSTLATGAQANLAYAYPNPFLLSEQPTVTFTNIPAEAALSIYSSAGDLVITWPNTSGDDILWDGRNESGYLVASGVYLWYLIGTEMKGKLVLRH